MNQICSSVNFYLNLIAVIIVFPALDFPADDGAIWKRQDSIVIAECCVDDLSVTAGQEHQHHGDNEENAALCALVKHNEALRKGEVNAES